jgi:hypothetical protein
MNELTISPKIDKGIKTLQAKVDQIEVVDIKSAEEAGELVKAISELKEAIEAQRLEFTKPLNESLKNINGFFKKFSVPLTDMDKIIRAKLVDFKNSRIVKDNNTFGEIHFVTRKSILIEDETKIPREYLSPDINKIQKALDNGIEVPGVKQIAEEGVSL